MKKRIINYTLAIMLLLSGCSNIKEEIKINNEISLKSIYHLSVKDGWSNDLQTIYWNDEKGYYDIYFLHSKDGATNVFGDGGQDWYHTTTKDFLVFSEQSVAIESMGGDENSGWKSAWTGSIIKNNGKINGAKEGELVAYISGLRKDNTKQAIWAVASIDNGKTFTKILNNGKPLFDAEDENRSRNKLDERDPYVFTWKNKFYMYVAEGDDIGVYSSDDGISWEIADKEGISKILASTFFKGRTWQGNAPVECPVIKTLKLPSGEVKQVLFFGAKDKDNFETTGTYYIVGTLDENGLFIAETDVQRLDSGSDYYGANFTGSSNLDYAEEKIFSLGWIGNWNYTSKGVHSTENGGELVSNLGSYSLARELTLDNSLKIRQNVIEPKMSRELEQNATVESPLLENQELKQQNTESNFVLYDIPNQNVASKYEMNFENISDEKINIDIFQGSDYVKLSYDVSSGVYEVSSNAVELKNGLEGNSGYDYYFDGLLDQGRGYSGKLELKDKNFLNLKIFADKTSLEFEFNDETTYTIARYSQNTTQDIKIYTTKKSTTLNIKSFEYNN